MNRTVEKMSVPHGKYKRTFEIINECISKEVQRYLRLNRGMYHLESTAIALKTENNL